MNEFKLVYRKLFIESKDAPDQICCLCLDQFLIPIKSLGMYAYKNIRPQ